MEKINPSYFYWQVVFRHDGQDTVIGYIKQKRINKFKFSVKGTKWKKCKSYDTGIRRLLKEHGFDGIKHHGNCLVVPETFKKEWI